MLSRTLILFVVTATYASFGRSPTRLPPLPAIPRHTPAPLVEPHRAEIPELHSRSVYRPMPELPNARPYFSAPVANLPTPDHGTVRPIIWKEQPLLEIGTVPVRRNVDRYAFDTRGTLLFHYRDRWYVATDPTAPFQREPLVSRED